GYAGMMTEDLEPRMRDIPDVSNFPRNEVIIQKSHRYPFDHQIRQTGAKLVEVDPRGNDCRQSTRKLWPFTLPISCPTKERSAARRPWQSPRSTTCTPSTMPPRTCRRKSGFGNIRPWASTCSPSAEARISADRRLRVFSTRSGSTPLSRSKISADRRLRVFLIGKEELIRYALLNMSPQEDRIGRCCKVGKETILGLLKALEIFVNQDFDATLKIYDERAQVITDAIKKFGVAENGVLADFATK